MTAPIALQLYTVREAMAGDFTGVVERVADMGYVGVEPIYKLPGTTTGEAARLFKDLGLAVPSAHVPLPLGDDERGVLDFMAAMDSPCIISGKGPDGFFTLDLLKRTCDLFNEAQAVAAANGLSLGYHNHWWEYGHVEGRYVYQVMLERLDPAIAFEIDTYWVWVAGLDPAAVVRELGSRVRWLHIKDGPGVREAPMLPLGEGKMDIPAVVRAGGDTVEWHIVELDRCDTDMVEAAAKSYTYLVEGGLSHGKAG